MSVAPFTGPVCAKGARGTILGGAAACSFSLLLQMTATLLCLQVGIVSGKAGSALEDFTHSIPSPPLPNFLRRVLMPPETLGDHQLCAASFKAWAPTWMRLFSNKFFWAVSKFRRTLGTQKLFFKKASWHVGPQIANGVVA